MVCPKSLLRKLRSETFSHNTRAALCHDALHREPLNVKDWRCGVRVSGTNSTPFGFACIKKSLTGLIRERPLVKLLLTFKVKNPKISPRGRKTGWTNNQMGSKHSEGPLPYGSGSRLRCFSRQDEKSPRWDANNCVGIALRIPAGTNPNGEKTSGDQHPVSLLSSQRKTETHYIKCVTMTSVHLPRSVAR